MSWERSLCLRSWWRQSSAPWHRYRPYCYTWTEISNRADFAASSLVLSEMHAKNACKQLSSAECNLKKAFNLSSVKYKQCRNDNRSNDCPNNCPNPMTMVKRVNASKTNVKEMGNTAPFPEWGPTVVIPQISSSLPGHPQGSDDS